MEQRDTLSLQTDAQRHGDSQQSPSMHLIVRDCFTLSLLAKWRTWYFIEYVIMIQSLAEISNSKLWKIRDTGAQHIASWLPTSSYHKWFYSRWLADSLYYSDCQISTFSSSGQRKCHPTMGSHIGATAYYRTTDPLKHIKIKYTAPLVWLTVRVRQPSTESGSWISVFVRRVRIDRVTPSSAIFANEIAAVPTGPDRPSSDTAENMAGTETDLQRKRDSRTFFWQERIYSRVRSMHIFDLRWVMDSFFIASKRLDLGSSNFNPSTFFFSGWIGVVQWSEKLWYRKEERYSWRYWEYVCISTSNARRPSFHLCRHGHQLGKA